MRSSWSPLGWLSFFAFNPRTHIYFFPLEMRSTLTKAMCAICVYIAGEGSVGRLQRRWKVVPQGGTRERRSIHTRKQDESNVERTSHPPFPGQDGSKLRTRGHMKTLEWKTLIRIPPRLPAPSRQVSQCRIFLHEDWKLNHIPLGAGRPNRMSPGFFRGKNKRHGGFPHLVKSLWSRNQPVLGPLIITLFTSSWY